VAAAPAAIAPTDRLYVPHRKRMAHAYVTSEAGITELCIYYGAKEVTFDEERLFAFGEQLMARSSFTAESATTWGPGYAWAEVRELLEVLIAEGIIKRAELAGGEVVEDARGGGPVPSRLPPSQCPVPRAWSDEDCEAITRELGGRAVELGHLEAIVPSYRIAHPRLDGDGRQVGEANVYPAGLRLDRETEWRVCQYPGSRYRDDTPMNVTALKAMIKYWKPMMVTLLEVRAEVLQRLVRSRGGWTTGDLHTFARIVLALPTFQHMVAGGSADHPPLHPVLSSLYRITDGIRMTTHDMLFLSAERTRAPDEAITAAELYGFAERNGLFLSDFGVCAGPKAMIDEFFAAVFDGTPVAGADGIVLPAEVRDLLAQLPAAVDYALLGLQVWGVSRSVWLAMTELYRTLRDVFETATGAAAGRLRARIPEDWRMMVRERIAGDEEFQVHRVVYADAYEQSWRGLRSPVGPARIADRIAACPERPLHAAIAARLRTILDAQLADSDLAGTPAVARVVDALVRYLREEQAILASVGELQEAINALLDRRRPTRPLSVRDLRVTFVMHGGPSSAFPYVLDMLEDVLGIRVECTADAIAVSDVPAAAGPHVLRQHSAGGQ
jgi:hypothetical protein